MELTPSSSLPKRTRAKPKLVKDPVETQSAAAKKPRAPRKTPTRKPVATESVVATEVQAESQVIAATLEPAPEDMGTMIATAAYFLAAARDFSPGRELDDWLEAERVVHAKLYG